MSTDSKTTAHGIQSAECRQVILYITDGGRRLAKKIADGFPGSRVLKYDSKSFSAEWVSPGNIICIMATGIVVRTIAPLLKDKKTDPAVVVLDEKGKYVISLLSGHIGGANKLAEKIAGYLGAEAVITTASDVQGKVALDVWAMENNLFVEDYEQLKRLSAKIVNGQKVKVRMDCSCRKDRMPDEFVMVGKAEKADIMVTNRTIDGEQFFLRPKNLFAGIGCNRGTSKEEIEETVNSILRSKELSMHSINSIASIDLKKDEGGLLEFACDRKLGINFFTKDELNSISLIHNIAASAVVKAATGAVAVAEPAAILAAKKEFGNAELIIKKQKRGNVTLAIAEAGFTL